jgi:hypothetical protein
MGVELVAIGVAETGAMELRAALAGWLSQMAPFDVIASFSPWPVLV